MTRQTVEVWAGEWREAHAVAHELRQAGIPVRLERRVAIMVSPEDAARARDQVLSILLDIG